MQRVSVMVLVLCAAACLCGGAQGATYYVASGGSDGWPGTEGQPWETLQHAVDTIGAGDTILVKAGTYAGCRIESSGTEGAVCTLKAEAGAQVVIDSAGASNRHNSNLEVEWYDEVVRYWVIEGLEVANSAAWGVDLRNTEYITVRDCYVHGSAITGIFTAFSNYPTIEENESASNGEHGIYQSNSGDHPTIRGNRLHDNYSCGIHMNGDLSMGGDGQISWATVEGNTIWGNGTGGGSAINCDGVSDSVFRNNLCYDNHAGGISLYAMDGAAGSSRNKVYNNTFVMASDARWVVNIPASDGKANPTANEVKNNILYTSQTNRGSVLIYGSAALSGSDYNAVVDRFSTTGESPIITLAQWQAAGFGEHSFLATPGDLFVEAGSENFRLKTGSPAIDAGAALAGVTEDLEGVLRPQGTDWDVGCYEVEQSPGVPVADFAATPPAGVKPLYVRFSDLSTGVPTSWAWDFGDGGSETQRNPSHVYEEAGKYAAGLSVSNGLGSDGETKAGYVRVASFPDALPGHWAWEEIEGCVAADIVRGYPGGVYAPGGSVTRAQMAVFISRSICVPTGEAGMEGYTPEGPASFADVGSGYWAYKYVEYAAERAVVGGYPDGRYYPERWVTRDQMAVFVARAKEWVGIADDMTAAPELFPDVPAGFWCGTAIEECVGHAVVSGYENGYYRPGWVVSRDQMAVFVARAFGVGI